MSNRLVPRTTAARLIPRASAARFRAKMARIRSIVVILSCWAMASIQCKHSLQLSELARLPEQKGRDADKLFMPQARPEARATPNASLIAVDPVRCRSVSEACLPYKGQESSRQTRPRHPAGTQTLKSDSDGADCAGTVKVGH